MAAQSAYAVAVDSAQSQSERPSEQLLPVGARIGDGGRYVVQEIVAVGGMATVYKAADSRLGMAPCAVKALFRPAPEQEANGADEAAKTFQGEARLLAGLSHSGIVAVRDFFEQQTAFGNFSFIVEEFVDGQNLYDRHRRLPRIGEDPENVPIAPVPEDQAALYGFALAQALDYLHTRKPAVLYRDLKPHNVIRRASDGQLVLLDFGISRRASGRANRCYSDDLGTPGYAAPEQYERFGILNARTDIYSLGVVLIELATGYNPRADDAPRLVPRVKALGSQLSASFAGILQRCVEPSPDQRYASARELICALEEWRATPRRLRRRHSPEIAWTIEPPLTAERPVDRVKRPQVAACGESGGTFAVAFPNGELRILDAASGETLAARKAVEPRSASARRVHLLPEPNGCHFAASLEPAANEQTDSASEIAIYDSGLKTNWRAGVPRGRLLAAWLDQTEPQNGSLGAVGARLAVASRPAQNTSARSKSALACLTQNTLSGDWRYEWRVPLAGDPALLAVGGNGGVLALDSSGHLTALDARGGERWREEIAILRNATCATQLIALEQCSSIALVCAGTSVEAIGMDDGGSRWRMSWIGSAFGSPVPLLDGSEILLPTRESGLVELDARTGRETPLSVAFPRPLAGIARLLPEADVFAVAERGAGARILLYDAQRGKLIWEALLPGAGAVGAPCVSNEAEIITVTTSNGAVMAWRWSDAL